MATLSVKGRTLCVELTRFERVFGILPNLSIPLGSVTGIRHDDGILRDIGMRAPGLAWPRRALIGTFRKWKFKDYVVWTNQPHFIVIDVDGVKWDRLVIGVEAPEATLRALNSPTT